MSVIKKNIVANFGGSIWTGLMSLVFVPIYIRFLGIEAYGLIGIFASLLAIFSLLDMGLSSTLNREMARLAVQESKTKEMRDLLRTLEIPYWAVALIISATVIGLSSLIAHRWVSAVALTPEIVERAIIIMGIVTGFQWPLSLYSGGLIGLQRQVLLNIINAIVATCRGLGAVLILWLISPTIEAFFTWQICVSLAHTGLTAFFLWRSLPKASCKPHFRLDLLRTIWRFAAGVTGITLFATILTQLDKVILSRMLSLEMFGYYSLANVVAMNLRRLISPVFTATYPRLNNLVELGRDVEISRLYHKSAQLVSVLTLPVSVAVALFSKEILLLWTQDPHVAEHSYVLVSILIAGTAFNGLMYIPYALQLAYGWTRLNFYVNLVSISLLTPLTIALTISYGAVGAASVWVILNVGYVLFGIQIMHARLLPREKWRWYITDTGIPLFVSLLVLILFRTMISVPSQMIFSAAFIVAALCASIFFAALSTSVTRQWLFAKVSLRQS